MLLLAFDCCLRPSDFLQLRRRDIRLPSDLASDDPEGFVILCESEFAAGPKTRKRSARRQQVKIDDPRLVALLEVYLAPFAPDDFLLAGGYQKTTAERGFRRAFDMVFGELGFICSDADGIVPYGLRAGGVTEMFRRTEDIALVRWRCRWDSLQSLEHYLQEMGAAEQMGRLDPEKRQRCKRLARKAEQWLWHALRK